MEKEKGRWITVKGTHVFIKDGQTVGEAIQEMKRHALTEQESFAIIEGRDSALTDSQGFYRTNTSYESIKSYQEAKISQKAIRVSVTELPKNNSYRLPNSISASTIQEKIQGYFLNSNHPVGKHKARVLNSVLGYHYENWEELSNKMFDAIQTASVKKVVVAVYGTKYKVPITIIGKKNKSMVLNTVWQIDKGTNIPRFITTTFDKRTIKEVK